MKETEMVTDWSR